MANHSGMLYTGVTNDLRRRLYVHKHGLLKGYTSKYNIKTLVYYEVTSDIRAAIAREKQIKGWVRRKKVTLIESVNPKWEDMSREWFGDDTTAVAGGSRGHRRSGHRCQDSSLPLARARGDRSE
jgi:putative endonuclease